MKHTYANLSDLMMELSPLELQDLPDYVQECSVMFMPEIGFLLSISTWKNDLTVDEMHLPGFKFKVTCLPYLYFKTRFSFTITIFSIHFSLQQTT